MISLRSTRSISAARPLPWATSSIRSKLGLATTAEVSSFSFSIEQRQFVDFYATQSHSHCLQIPVIDFSKFRVAKSKRETADKIVGAFKDSGFVYLTGHGIPESTITRVFDKVRNSCFTYFLCSI
jgi:hypothetical protein